MERSISVKYFTYLFPLAVPLLFVCFQTEIFAEDDSLIGHWSLMGNVEDQSGSQNNGVNHGVILKPNQPAWFDGRNAFIEVPHSESLSLGTDEFSISVYVNTDAVLDDVIGNILGKYDPQSRKGFQLSIKNHAGVTRQSIE